MHRLCKRCNVKFRGKTWSVYCPDCARLQKLDAVLRQRICRQCSASFIGGPRAWYCPDCRSDRQRKQGARAKERARTGKTRKLGSTDRCVVCGGEYTVTGGLQKYCPQCAPDAVRSIDRAASLKWAAENADPARKSAERKASAAAVKCAICGAEYVPTTAQKTCSGECAEELKRRNSVAYEKMRRAERNEYHRKWHAAKIAAMSPEELTAYRAAINARARQNYKKRKQAGVPAGKDDETNAI